MKKFLHKYQTYCIFLLVILIPLFGMLPLFHTGFFPIHDDEQVGRLVQLHIITLQGQFPPRWVPELGFGYGYPLYNFYPPLFYYVGEIFKIVGFGFIFSTKLALVIGFIFSSLSMYLWVKNRFGSLSGIFAALVYTYVPYHAIDIYVRGAFSEFFSFIFIPAVFLAMDKVSNTRRLVWIIVLSILLACVVLSHNLVALQAIPFIILYAGFLVLEKRKNAKRIVVSLSAAGIISLLLTAYFWLPSLAEKQYTLVDTILTKELANYAIHFVCPAQLWNSPWGFGGSAAGCQDGLSFQLGKLQILFVILAFSGLFLRKSKDKFFAGFLLFLFACSVFMTVPYSKFIWDHISVLWYIQFPWRFLLLAGVFSAALAGYAFSLMQEVLPKKISMVLFVVLSGFFVYQVRHDFQPQRYMSVQDDHYITNITWEVSKMSYEYVPKEVATVKSSLGTTELAIAKKDIAQMPYKVISGKLQVSTTQNTVVDQIYAVDATSKGLLQINTYAFPGWIVIVDGEKVRYNDNNKLHLIQIPLQKGKHVVRVSFTNTWPRTVGNTLSLLTVISVLGSLAVMKKKKL